MFHLGSTWSENESVSKKAKNNSAPRKSFGLSSASQEKLSDGGKGAGVGGKGEGKGGVGCEGGREVRVWSEGRAVAKFWIFC